MSFKLWKDETMKTELGTTSLLEGARHLPVLFQQGKGQVRDFVFYFGSNDANVKLQTVKNGGVDPIQLIPKSALPVWEKNTQYSVDDLCDVGNGYVYQATQGGVSAPESHSWLKKAGAVMNDGTAIWLCLGKREPVSAVQLSLSKEGLDRAKGGAALSLGTSIPSKTALAVHMRITSVVDDIYSVLNLPILALHLNDCEEVNSRV